jgi:phosphate transport system ATP-binding protein
VEAVLEAARSVDTDAPVKMQVRDLTVTYHGATALEAVSIDILANQVTALIGPSGCGKSTFLRCLNRMNDHILGAAVHGSVTMDGF